MLRRNKESGQALVFGIATLGILFIGIAGLGIDTGYLRYQKRLQQAAADSAAIEGAADYAFGGHSAAVAGSAAAAATNGFADNTGATGTPCGTASPTGCVTVTVNNPPLSGPHSGDSNYVEAYVAQVHPTFFMKLLGTTNETITARAVATNVGGGTGSGCLYTLGTPASSIEGVNINGAATLTAPSCGIIDDGNFNTQGNKLVFHSDTFGVAGDWNKSGPGGTVTCAGSPSCPTTTNMPPAGDPLANLVTAPPVGTPITFNANNIIPGSTYNGISIPANTTVNFPAGTYIVSGGNFNVPGNSTVCNSTNANCSGMPGSANAGVTFYLTNGATVNVVGTPSIRLAAPNSGTYGGILFYQDPADTNTNGPRLGGDSSSFFQGSLYFPNDQLTFFGNGTFNSQANYTIVVVKSLSLSGSPDVVLSSNYSGLPNGVSIIKNAVLVE